MRSRSCGRNFASGRFHGRHDRTISRHAGSQSIDPRFDARVRQLVADWGAEKSPELIEEMIITALKMARDKMGTGDLKLMNRSLKEMRYAAKVFAAYRQFRKVCVFGSARTPPSEAEYEVAEEFARADGGARLHGHHRRRRRHHGRGAARRRARAQLRSQHPPALRAARERDHRRRPEADQLQLLLHPQTQLRERNPRLRAFPRRLRHDGRRLRGAHAHADRQGADHSGRVARSARMAPIGRPG